jgi:hypothetical protein
VGADSRAGLAPIGVCVKNVGAKAFPLVAALFWLPVLQPDENMQVSGGADGVAMRSGRLRCAVTTR